MDGTHAVVSNLGHQLIIKTFPTHKTAILLLQQLQVRGLSLFHVSLQLSESEALLLGKHPSIFTTAFGQQFLIDLFTLR
jgi:hypothetical protein